MRFRSTSILLIASLWAVDAAAQVDPALFSAMRYRQIGPTRGGRVTTVTGVPSQPFTFYMGSTGGGVWKTTNAGQTWVNVSDPFFTMSAQLSASAISSALSCAT